MDLLIAYAMSFIGTPYISGGNNPLTGFDCSGLACEVMRPAGLVGYKEDLTAQGLYDKFESNSTQGVRGPGVLAFYGKSVREIIHVGVMIDAFRMIEAGGGDSTTKTVEEARQRNAFVRIRQVTYRTDLIATMKPRYAGIGLY